MAKEFKPVVGVHYWNNNWTKPTPESAYANDDYVQIDKGFYWRLLEPIQGKYDFSSVKTELDLAVKYKKPLGILIASGGSSPYWVNPENSYKITGIRQDGDGKVFTVEKYPYPFDKSYSDAWVEFIDAFGAWVNQTPQYAKSIVSVNVGGTTITNGELRLPSQNPTDQNPELTNTDEIWQKNGYNPDMIISNWVRYRNAWGRNFPNAMFVTCMLTAWEFPNYNNPTALVKYANYVNDELLQLMAMATNPSRYIVINTSLTVSSRGNGFINNAIALGVYTAYQLNEQRYNNDYSQEECAKAVTNGVRLQSRFIQFQPVAAENNQSLIKTTNATFKELYG